MIHAQKNVLNSVNHYFKTISFCFALFLSLLIQHISIAMDLRECLVRNTFMIEGPSFEDNKRTTGTAFLVGRPKLSNPTRSWLVLVTAAHVLENIKGELATFHCRKKEENKFKRIPYNFPIRKNGKILWKKHQKADVAAMYYGIPSNYDSVDIISTNVFINDSIIDEKNILPGDIIYVLGFPLGVGANDAGFPILRSGVIASYPVARIEGGNSIIIDFSVFEGNSGGPVFLNDLTKGLLGLVTRMGKKEKSGEEKNLDLGIVIHASVIKETINMLPEREPHLLDSNSENDENDE